MIRPTSALILPSCQYSSSTRGQRSCFYKQSCLIGPVTPKSAPFALPSVRVGCWCLLFTLLTVIGRVSHDSGAASPQPRGPTVTSVTAGIHQIFLISSRGLAVILVLPGASAPAGTEERNCLHSWPRAAPPRKYSQAKCLFSQINLKFYFSMDVSPACV